MPVVTKKVNGKDMNTAAKERTAMLAERAALMVLMRTKRITATAAWNNAAAKT
jgi:hypothetical protein